MLPVRSSTCDRHMPKAIDDGQRYPGTAHVDPCQSHRADPDVPVQETFGAVRKSSGRP